MAVAKRSGQEDGSIRRFVDDMGEWFSLEDVGRGVKKCKTKQGGREGKFGDAV